MTFEFDPTIQSTKALDTFRSISLSDGEGQIYDASFSQAKWFELPLKERMLLLIGNSGEVGVPASQIRNVLHDQVKDDDEHRLSPDVLRTLIREEKVERLHEPGALAISAIKLSAGGMAHALHLIQAYKDAASGQS